MKKFACVTSMNQAYYEKCGRACIESYGANWPADIQLYVYNEDMIDPPRHRWVTYMPWDLGKDYDDFFARTTGSRTLQFAKKAFSVMHAMENLDCDRLIWIDADVMSTYPVNYHLLNLLSDDQVLSAHYGVKHNWPSQTDPDRISFSCETGFFVVNRNHPMFETMAARYREYYTSDLGIHLRRFYDGEVYGSVVAEMESQGAKLMELNPGQQHKTPIPRSVMAPYIKHYKAGAKESYTSESLLKELNHVDHSDLS
jgi:hypothetical protein